jgi:hypothetical protein
VEVEVLGRSAVTVADRHIEINSRNQRLPLAVLLAANGARVRRETLTDAPWGEPGLAAEVAELHLHSGVPQECAVRPGLGCHVPVDASSSPRSASGEQ